MTHLLWKYYWQDDVEKFRRLLSPAGHGAQNAARSPNIGAGGHGSPGGGFGTSPRPSGPRSRKPPGLSTPFGNGRHGSVGLGRSEVNSRDHAGLTILLRAASSSAENAISFVEALVEHPAIDIYAQDPESGWNALHRALYAGNISIARLLLEKEHKDLTGHTSSFNRVGQLIKTKDHEGNSPFDLYNSTIGERNLKELVAQDSSEHGSDSDEADVMQDKVASATGLNACGEDLYAFGSNKNHSLGFGDEDDRQFPERVFLKRPDHLLQRFHNEYLEQAGLEESASQDIAKIPALVLNKPLMIQDVVLAKFHSAVLTRDPVSNLYICGIGRGGRLGLGDENTRFTYAAVQGPLADRKIVQVALGQNHSVAVDDTGALWTWGSNANFQLGYAPPVPPKKDEDPISTVPRQVFGPLKKEIILGIAASSIHSVAHTGSSLYCWGKNVGQLALMDADSRSLEFQQTPRKVAASLFSSPIVMVTAIDKATTILLQNHTVCVFTGYGYHIVKFPFAGIDMVGSLRVSTRYEPGRNQIQHVTSGGETIAALTGRGDLFTMNLDHNIEANLPATSTTNPSKLKGAVSTPQCIWSARKDGARSVGVGEHGSVIISTKSGAVWRRTKRANAKDVNFGPSESRRKDFKFQRVPCITRVATVRASPSGAFAAVRQDSDVMKEQLVIDEPTLWKDIAKLNPLNDFKASENRGQNEATQKFWENDILRTQLGSVAYEALRSPDLDADLLQYLTSWGFSNEPMEASICTTTSPSLRIPIHSWLLAARSSVLRNGLAQFRKSRSYILSEAFSVEDVDGKPLISFQGLDLMSLLNLALYMYEDKVVPAWNFTRQAPSLAYRYRQVRLEVMKLATRLNLGGLEAAARLQTPPRRCIAEDFRLAVKERRFFEDGDALLELDRVEVPVHSAFVCQRCPWFEGLFHGRAGGLWLASRRNTTGPGSDSPNKIRIDLKHMDPGAFKYVLRYLYGDSGAELFDPAVCDSFDDFLDLVMEVMSIANYLMLDRLSQTCQQVMGRFANIRNIAHLLNAISPCSITEFKDAGLEYICLQLESMLENHLLDELDEDLLLELDDVVRDNQASQFRYTKRGQAELLLHEIYPWLAQDIEEERETRIKEMAFKAHKDDDRKASSSFKGKSSIFDELGPSTPSPDRARKASKAGRNEPFTPDLRPKTSQADLIFDMDDEDSAAPDSPLMRTRTSGGNEEVEEQPLPAKSLAATQIYLALTPPAAACGGKPWGPATVAASKTDLRDIIQSEATTRSALSVGLLAHKAREESPKFTQPKLSQKEKKRQQQQQQAQAQAVQASSLTTNSGKNAWDSRARGDAQTPAWKPVPIEKKTPSNTLLTHNISSPPVIKPLLTAEAGPVPIRTRTASPDTRFSGQRLAGSSSLSGTRPPVKATSITPGSSVARTPIATETPAPPLVPHSKTYLTPARKAEPLLGYSMEDIIVQQRREQERVREAAAKRSLQEIQQEQAFQEWWDAESRRTQEEEAKRLDREKDTPKERGVIPKVGGRRGRGGKSRGGGTGSGRGGGDAGGMQSSRGKGRGRREATSTASGEKKP
ncbi:hypothetical protein B0T26DRAFT_652768 [Lasiosphaeria miniovina]|uniref:BTB domain-containing protein n=1 Tax=Lasiosphaeria miniovina TaxID=1954250 RepID=A0AA40A5Z0_9PEZI|nr:uncharacterized protein B0T26DRAFT_652768 [Lasiosphaeria miniovina]KAK0709816.1 hypothetical protein B0T26DRAFT_652768 [Lasiosphaeria miniovina]